MDWTEQLDALRTEIDQVDRELIPLFLRRMDAARRVAGLKQANNLPVLDTSREQQVVDRAAAQADEELQGEAALLMRTMMALSRAYQHRLLHGQDIPLLPAPVPPQKQAIAIAYQGVPGAWAEQAAASLFPQANRQPAAYFEDVFLAVRDGAARYGVVPIENSQTGAIGETYDLLRKYGCYIVGRTWVDIRQCLLGLPGAKLDEIDEVLSHPEALKQCRSFLQSKGWAQTTCRNTAVAARQVAEGSDPKKAAIGAPLAAQLYDLAVLQPDIMDSKNNRTAFVVIAAQPEYNEESNRVAFTFSTMHRSGALCEALLPLMAGQLNLLRIESRPVSPEKYRFFAEIDGNITCDGVAAALRQMAAATEYFEVLGCYTQTKGETI